MGDFIHQERVQEWHKESFCDLWSQSIKVNHSIWYLHSQLIEQWATVRLRMGCQSFRSPLLKSNQYFFLINFLFCIHGENHMAAVASHLTFLASGDLCRMLQTVLIQIRTDRMSIDKQGSKIARNSVFDCHLSPVCDKWQSKTLFLTIFYLCSLIVLTFSIPAYPVWALLLTW